MKFHTSLLQAVVSTIYSIFAEHKMADKAIQAVLKSNRKWGSRDRAFIAENAYEIVRWWRLLHFINGTNIDNYHPSTLWRLLGTRLRLMKYDLPDLAEFKGIAKNYVDKRFEESKKIRKVYQSIPDWLDALGEKELGQQWDKLLPFLNEQAPMAIRVNTLKTNYQALEERLSKENIELIRVKSLSNAAFLKYRANLFSTTSFKEGLFEMQDPGSQLISEFMDVKPGMRVIDACAGAGGKSLHLACLMENKGTIVALDTEEWKLEELKKRAKRNGVHNIDARIVNGKVVKRLAETADALLLDVPCSGLGVLRRNPDAKWKLQSNFIEEIKVKQKDILWNYSKMLKPGGKLVYATCSILPSENWQQVQSFLEGNDNFALIKEQSTDPAKDGFDGFYMALLQKLK